jgi:putative transposase
MAGTQRVRRLPLFALAMSRPLRLHVPGMLYHVFARGNEKKRIFADHADFKRFLLLLRCATERFDGRCIAYCGMPNHYHLLIAAGRHPVSRIMHYLNSTYSQWFNQRHQRVGHLLQGRFGCRIVQHGAYARLVLRYIALNPVKGGYVRDPAEWPWSSYRFAARSASPPAFLALDYVWLAFSADDPEVGRARFVHFVSVPQEDWLEHRLVYGSRRFREGLAPLLEPYHSEREHSYAERFAARPPLRTIFDRVASRRGPHAAAHVAFHQHAYTLAEIGALVSRHPSTVSRWIRASGVIHRK